MWTSFFHFLFTHEIAIMGVLWTVISMNLAPVHDKVCGSTKLTLLYLNYTCRIKVDLFRNCHAQNSPVYAL